MSEGSDTTDPKELARSFADALDRRDFDAAVAMLAPKAVVDTSPAGGFTVYEGRNAVRDMFEGWTEPYDDYHAEFGEVYDLGDGITLSMLVGHGRLRDSGGFVERRVASVAISAEGLIERVTLYRDTDEARAAAERLAQERA